MKKVFFISLFIMILSPLTFAQKDDSRKNPEEFRTLLGDSRHNGFYGAFSIGYTEIGDRHAIMFGGRFEWLMGHSLGIGFGGSGFLNESHFEPSLNTDVFLAGGYGGLYLEPVLFPNYPVHLSFPILLGGGGISYVTKDWDVSYNMIEDSEAFLIAEPAAELELNLTRNFRLAIGASYRFTTPFHVGMSPSTVVSTSALRGINYMMTFKFGKF